MPRDDGNARVSNGQQSTPFQPLARDAGLPESSRIVLSCAMCEICFVDPSVSANGKLFYATRFVESINA